MKWSAIITMLLVGLGATVTLFWMDTDPRPETVTADYIVGTIVVGAMYVYLIFLVQFISYWLIVQAIGLARRLLHQTAHR